MAWKPDLSTGEAISSIIAQSRAEIDAMLAAAGMAPLANEPGQQQIDELTAAQLRQAIKDQKARAK